MVFHGCGLIGNTGIYRPCEQSHIHIRKAAEIEVFTFREVIKCGILVGRACDYAQLFVGSIVLSPVPVYYTVRHGL